MRSYNVTFDEIIWFYELLQKHFKMIINIISLLKIKWYNNCRNKFSCLFSLSSICVKSHTKRNVSHFVKISIFILIVNKKFESFFFFFHRIAPKIRWTLLIIPMKSIILSVANSLSPFLFLLLLCLHIHHAKWVLLIFDFLSIYFWTTHALLMLNKNQFFSTNIHLCIH